MYTLALIHLKYLFFVCLLFLDPEPESTIEKMKSKISSGYESMKSGFQTGDRTE